MPLTTTPPGSYSLSLKLQTPQPPLISSALLLTSLLLGFYMKYSGITHLLFWYVGVPLKSSQNHKLGEFWVLRWGNRRVRRASISAGITQRLEVIKLGSEKGRSFWFLLLALSSCLQFLAPSGRKRFSSNLLGSLAGLLIKLT